MGHNGIVYLLHFERSYRHARHYIGFTQNLEQRLAEHRAGRGSPLLPIGHPRLVVASTTVGRGPSCCLPRVEGHERTGPSRR